MKIKLNNDFCIWLVSPEKETRSETLKEVAVSLSDSFKALGHNVPIVTSPKNITEYPIILNANLLNKTEHNFLPKNSIIFNFEQIYEKSPWLTPFYLSLLKNHIVFDYSNNNINTLKSFGIQNVHLCKIGYSKSLEIIPQNHFEIDFLMYGRPNERRISIIKKLNDLGYKSIFLENTYGNERDTIISKSKIILNIHYYDASIFEIVRISYLLTNKKFVISEIGSDKDLENDLDSGLIFGKYDEIIKLCKYYIDKTEDRNRIALRGYKLFKEKKQKLYLEKLFQV